MSKVRRVLGPNGMTLMTFPKSKSQESVTTKEPEQKSEVSLKVSTVEVTKSLTVSIIRSMEPQELKVVAKEKNLKLGNVKDKVKMQDKVIKLLELEEDVL